ncbi:hypothetical protein JOC55_005877 [Paenibacillus sacheonensis]|nr:hypothetical protein [Paenibacillus sacheonensis]
MRKRYYLLLMAICTIASSVFVAGPSAAEAATASKIADFDSASLIRADGTYWVWGNNRPVPTQIQALSDVEAAFPGNLVMKKDGSVWNWLPISTGFRVDPVKGVERLSSVQDEWNYIIAVEESGDVAVIPRDTGFVVPDATIAVDGIDNVEKVSGYYERPEYKRYLLFLKKDGTLWGSAPSEDNMLSGLESVAGMDHVVDIAGNLALKNDGSVWAMSAPESAGASAAGASPRLIATKMRELAGIVRIATNDRSNLAVDKLGHVWFWGETLTGMTDGTVTYEHPVPTELTTVKDARDVAIVERSLIVLTADGTVTGTSIDRETMPANPVFRKMATGMVRLEPGMRHLIMQKADGSLWGWGINKQAELGYGDYEFSHDVPVPVQKAVTVTVNGERVALMNGVIIRSDQAFIPLRSVFEKLGAAVTWDFNLKIAAIKRPAGQPAGSAATTITMNFQTGALMLNGAKITLKQTPFIENGTTYPPLRFISESLGAQVAWDANADLITIQEQ